MTAYDANFYEMQSAESRRSASVVVPIVMELFRPKSVVDFGCGVGTWLAEFAAAGVLDYEGRDGNYVPRDQLQIPGERFHPTDLTKLAPPARRFDVAMSVEVAEHLPAHLAASFVAVLVAAAPVVLFSAAIPHQGGVDHINEQWPEYWRALFREHGYRAIDAIRPRIWGHPEVAWWYQQNVVIYCHPAALDAASGLDPVPDDRLLNVVHPNFFTAIAERDPTLGEVLPILPRMLANSIAFRLGLRR